MGPNLNPEVVVGTRAHAAVASSPHRNAGPAKMSLMVPSHSRALDLYIPQGNVAQPVPIVVFVHGGGFRIGDKRGGENIAAYFARHGMLGVTINYRLAPEVTWPTQSLDLGNAIGWLRANAARFGGDPRTIVVIGHSSGAAVVASYLLDHSIDTARDGVVGAVLISGVYGYETRAPDYYGHDATKAGQPHAPLARCRNRASRCKSLPPSSIRRGSPRTVTNSPPRYASLAVSARPSFR